MYKRQGLTFLNSNGLTFGLSTGASVGSITASYTVPSVAGLISAINVSQGTTSENVTQLVFSNANGVSFNLSTAGGGPFATIYGSVAAQTTGGVYLQGNTSYTSSTTMAISSYNPVSYTHLVS